MNKLITEPTELQKKEIFRLYFQFFKGFIRIATAKTFNLLDW